MSKSEKEIFRELCEVLSPFNGENVELKPETDIAVDLNIDSVTIMDFIMEVEDRYDIDIPLNLLSEVRTMAELATLVKKRVG